MIRVRGEVGVGDVVAAWTALAAGPDAVIRIARLLGYVAVTPTPAPAAPIEPPVAPKTSSPAPKVLASAPTGLSFAGDLQELSDDHLETLLGEIDHMDALPQAEPEAMEPSVAGSGGDGSNR